MSRMRSAVSRMSVPTALRRALAAVVLCLVSTATILPAATGDYISCTVDIVFSPDSDGDGLTDAAEAWMGTDPAKADTDGDSMPDGWEAHFGFDPTNAVDGDLDADADTCANAHEYIADTDPTNPASYFRPIEILGVGALEVWAFPASTACTFYLDGRTNLMAGDWGELTNAAGTGNTNIFPVDTADPSAFYRVRVRRH